MTQARIQPFCKEYEINLGVYNLKQRINSPRSLTERSKCLFIHDNHFCVIQKKNQSTFPDASKELEDFFKHGSNEVYDVFLKQVIEYKFPTSYEKDCMFAVFAFDLETCNVENQLYCEAYAAGFYHLNSLYECFKGDLTKKRVRYRKTTCSCIRSQKQ